MSEIKCKESNFKKEEIINYSYMRQSHTNVYMYLMATKLKLMHKYFKFLSKHNKTQWYVCHCIINATIMIVIELSYPNTKWVRTKIVCF